ncbi:MAG TPA: prepilin-type N-terminal cleavage/methylation domain-containing protein [Candidatus Hydrogenedentes bacterium]|nr:prepilin-type N-terminal cleavage/methylation domain-containing protein [Candidatus Hydrogenedentota bacterium]HOS04395.1 prepilin-type N-terminal cleavage/methylation domain-containing protein [Candidatus Hydrogenedentota bacterium]
MFTRGDGRGVWADRGFTLVEVMIALAILGVALFVLLDAQYNGLRLHSSNSGSLAARQLVQRALAQAEIDVLAGNVSGTGDFGERHRGCSYSFDAAVVNEYVPGFYQIRVVVKTERETFEKTMFLYDTRR